MVIATRPCRHETVATARVADIAKAPFTDFFRHAAHALTEHGGEADLGHAFEQPLVDHLAPQSHARSQPGIGGYESRLRKGVNEILAEKRRLHERLSGVHARRHDP